MFECDPSVISRADEDTFFKPFHELPENSWYFGRQSGADCDIKSVLFFQIP